MAGATVPFDGAVDLIGKVAASDAARACVARQWLRFALGRDDAPADECAVQQALRAFRDAGWDVRALIAGIATSSTLLHVAVGAP